MTNITEMAQRGSQGKLTADDVELLISLLVKPLEECAAELGEYPLQQDRVRKAAAVLKGDER